jgi:pimeloyl-ACP methyl ester carboxylesterase
MKFSLNKSLICFTVFLVLLSGCVSVKVMFLDPPVKMGIVPLEATVKPKTFFVKTDDNWMLEINRFKLTKAEQDLGPVILLHGFHHNANFWDLDAEHSLARYLAVRGFDVWVLSFRGAGKSTTEGFVKVEGIVKFFTANVPAFLNPTTYDKSRMRWSIDDYIDHDFPAVLEFVCKESQRQEVSVIGHSLGGLVALCYLTKHPTDSRIKQFVAIGAPGVVIQPPNDMLSDVARNEALYYSTFLINAKVAAQLGAVLERHVTPFDVLFYNRFNIDRKTLVLMFAKTIEDVSLDVLDQMREMIRSGHFWNKDKRYDYSDNFKNIVTPGLFIAGVLDNIASPANVHYAYDAISSTDKNYREFSTVNGYKADYGHNDLILGKDARSEVFAYMYHWLTRSR